MKKFLIKISLFALPLLALIVTINGYKLHLHNSAILENTMVANILRGDYVTNLTDYNDRLFQKLMIAQMDSLPREIVLGSSRSMQITHEFATYTPFYNSSVFNGSVVDMMAIYKLYEEVRAPIKRIILTIDPWIFRNNDFQFETLEPIYTDYCAMCAKIGSTPRYGSMWLRKIDYLLSIQSLYRSATLIYKQKIASYKSHFIPTKDSLNVGETEYIDGSYSLNDIERNLTRRELMQIDVDHHLNTNSDKLEDSKIEEFEKFVLYLKNRGIEVVLLFSPHHPVVYQVAITKDKMMIETDNIVRKFATQNGIAVIGSYNPTLYNLDVIDFLNGGHPKKRVFYPIFGKTQQ